MVKTLVDINETSIRDLLHKDHEWFFLSEDLLSYARLRNHAVGMEKHHVEPEREEVVSLWPLEHLAIHICQAKLDPSDSTYAKVGSFVKSFPGNYRRIIKVSDKLRNKLVSFGQKRPSRTSEIMKQIANLPQTKTAQRTTGALNGKNNGIKSAEKVSKKLKGRKITWGDKISKAIEAKGTYICPNCGKVMKNIASNILQHQRSKKCN
jgi:hypothetical protein